MTTIWAKKILYECVACVCLTFGTISLVIAFFMAIGFLIVVLSFALTIDLYKVLCNSANAYFKKILLKLLYY